MLIFCAAPSRELRTPQVRAADKLSFAGFALVPFAAREKDKGKQYVSLRYTAQQVERIAYNIHRSPART